MPEPEAYQPKHLSGNAPSDAQSELAALSGEWGLKKLVHIEAEEARDNLARLSPQIMAIVARSARVADGNRDPVPDEVVAGGETAAEKFLLRWRGEADPAHVKAIDTYWICTAEHGLNASTFTARIVGLHRRGLRSSPVGGDRRTVRPTARRRSGPRDPDARGGRGDGRPRALRTGVARARRTDHGLRASHLPRGGPRARLLKQTARELGSPRVEVAEELERAALEELARRKPDRVLATNVEFWSAVVLDVAEIPPALTPAMFACARVAGWSAHILEEKRTGRLIRPSARYVGPASRSLASV